MISEEQFQRLLAALIHSTPETDPAKNFDTLAGRIVQFCYDPEADLTFEAWYRRHADIFTVDAKSMDEATRVRLLLHKLDAPSYEKYVNYILPQTPQEVKFDDAISTLKDLFGPQQSLFTTRYTCLKLAKDPKDDFATYAGRLAECNENQFQCLISVCVLQPSEDAFIRLKLLDKIESDPNCTIQILAEECKRLLNLRHDTKMIENGSPAVRSVKQFLPSRQGQQKVSSKTNAQATHPEIPPRLPPSACCFCGEMHFIKTALIDIINVPAAELSDTKKDTATHTNADPNDSAPPVQMLKAGAKSVFRPKRPVPYAAQHVVDKELDRLESIGVISKVASASDLTVINKETWQRIGEPELKPPSLIAQSASGDRIRLLGQRQCTYSFHDASAQGAFYGANTPSNFLGAEWIAKMGIYALMDCLPSTDPGQQAEINASIADQTSNNTIMERQFNREHGARRRTFKVGDPVLVKTYQGQQRWTNGQVLQRLGRVLYEVLVEKETWIRHTNQLRIRFEEGDHYATDDMDTLFEVFDLERPQSPIHSSTTLTDNA
ncbi:hypothetical protein ANCCAN_04873 [Ancylostoma caninum]|uniref:DUF7083 domain-containing protein n=1 Tax=Ancylostoma caninum TaxID=29170 RepID=A0A368GXB8_ANCCA|nr:hypothetical protein ANCCAN_04873 [Ancylostoma caninum]